jgi:hypothetical protein
MKIPWFNLTLIYKPEEGEARIMLRSLKRSPAVCGAFLHDPRQSLGSSALHGVLRNASHVGVGWKRDVIELQQSISAARSLNRALRLRLVAWPLG